MLQFATKTKGAKMARASILEKSFHKTLDWLYDIEDACGWGDGDQRKAFGCLRAVLHHLRDLLPIENAAHLSAQLPLLIRGLFFECWVPGRVPSRIRNKEEFLDAIYQSIQIYSEPDIEKITKNILRVIFQKLDPSEKEKIIKTIPEGLKELFYNRPPL